MARFEITVTVEACDYDTPGRFKVGRDIKLLIEDSDGEYEVEKIDVEEV